MNPTQRLAIPDSSAMHDSRTPKMTVTINTYD